jgi:hypothetical protein
MKSHSLSISQREREENGRETKSKDLKSLKDCTLQWKMLLEE